jgi:hypothetical protein
MKKSFLVLIFSLVAGMVSAQALKEAEVPAPVKKSFSKQYPAMKVESWRKAGDLYEARYVESKQRKGVTITAVGDIMELKNEVVVAELPATIKNYVAQNANNAKISEAYTRVDISGVTFYDVSVSNVVYVFDFDGNFVSKN